ncbi:MAG TPA: tetratricopeptide repeat protein [Candidatus Acidoferrales bacterium]|nr:tetratricopeptide repeat protein [Candidatus Acidoferrales bacterium]
MKAPTTHPLRSRHHGIDTGPIARGLISFLLLIGLVIVARQGLAAWIAGKDSLIAFRQAQHWDPSDPDYPERYALKLAADTPGVDPLEVVRSLEKATRLGPRRADLWASLGSALESAGRDRDAVDAYERARTLFPKSPEINWEFANLLIRMDEKSSAVAPLRQTILGDPALRTGAFDLAWRAQFPPDRILEFIPASQEIDSAYLDYLVRTGRFDAAASVWDRLLASPISFDLDAAFRYFDALLYDHRVDALTAMWRDLARHESARIHWRPDEVNLIMNGSFEEPVLNGGFDWRMPAIDGATAGFDRSIAYHGSRSLFVRFDGTRNIDFGHVVQYVRVQPHTSYHFLAYARAEGITTDSGPRIAVYDAFNREALSMETENLVGTINWREEELEFRTGPETNLIVVQVARHPSRKLDSQIAGTLWLDDFSLTATR